MGAWSIMKIALVILTTGFEDIEAVAPIDVLNRAGVRVTVAALDPGPVRAAYGTVLLPDTTITEVQGLFDAIIFPGGKANAQALANSAEVIELARRHAAAGKIVAPLSAPGSRRGIARPAPREIR